MLTDDKKSRFLMNREQKIHDTKIPVRDPQILGLNRFCNRR